MKEPLDFRRIFYLRNKLKNRMDIKQIQELVRLVTKSGIAELKIKEGDFSVSIKSISGTVQTIQQIPVQQTVAAVAEPQLQKAVAEKTETASANEEQEAQASNTYIFKSPMIGTFYRKPSADKEPYVKVGDNVKSGEVLCIIEAMKLFNEIEFDGGSGKIVKILVDDTSPVEYDQPLFLIEKLG